MTKFRLLLPILVLSCRALGDSTTPNMSLAINPNWPADLQSNFNKIDSHNHSSGQGVQVPVGGMSFLAPLSVNGQPITTILNLQLADGGSGPSIPMSLWFDGTNLWAEDGAGNKIQITNGGALNIPVVSGYVNGPLIVDGGITSLKDGGCYTTSNGAQYCDDGSGDAIIKSILNHNIVLQDGNDTATVWFQASGVGGPSFLVDGGLAVLNGNPLDLYNSGNGAVGSVSATSSTGWLFIPPGGSAGTSTFSGAETVSGKLNVGSGTFLDGGLTVWQASVFDGGVTVVKNLTVVGSIIGDQSVQAGASNGFSIDMQGNNLVGPSIVGASGALILEAGDGDIVTLQPGAAPSCGTLAACWGMSVTCAVQTAGTDTNGIISLTTPATTSSCAANASLFTVTFNTPYNNIPSTIVQLSGDGDAGATPALPNLYAQADAGAFIVSNTAAFTPNTLSTYTFSYHVFGQTDGGW